METDTISEREKRPIQSPQLLSGRDSAIFTTGGGGQEAAEGYPHTAVSYRLRAVLREGDKITQNESNSSTLLAGVRRGYGASMCINIFISVKRDSLLFFHFSGMRRRSWEMTRALFSLFGPIGPRIGRHGDTALASVTALRYSRYLDITVVLTLRRESERESEIKLNTDQLAAKRAYLNSHTP